MEKRNYKIREREREWLWIHILWDWIGLEIYQQKFTAKDITYAKLSNMSSFDRAKFRTGSWNTKELTLEDHTLEKKVV